MYAGGDSALQGYPKITRQEIEEYYREKDTIDESNRIKMAEWQKKKNRITLNEVTDIFSLLNDLLGKLVSLSYLKERDEMYLLLGFYSMAMNEEENWGEQLNQLDQDQDHVSGGLVLKQICAIFDFGLKLLYEDGRGGGIGGSLTVKINKFELKHKESWKTALQLFEDEQHLKALGDIRNYVDHMKYYTTPSRSIISLYNVYYTNMFAYNSKLRKSVIFNFKSILEKYFILAEVEFGDNRKFTLKNLRSTEFTYKLSQPEKGAKDNKVEARTKGFLNSVQQVLNYPV
jgi:hypothetical protein